MKDALMHICAVSVLTGVACGFAGEGRYGNAVRLLRALWIVSVLLEAAVCFLSGIS